MSRSNSFDIGRSRQEMMLPTPPRTSTGDTNNDFQLRVLHDRLMEQEKSQQNFLQNMYRMQTELSSNLKKTEMSQLEGSYHQRFIIVYSHLFDGMI